MECALHLIAFLFAGFHCAAGGNGAGRTATEVTNHNRAFGERICIHYNNNNNNNNNIRCGDRYWLLFRLLRLDFFLFVFFLQRELCNVSAFPNGNLISLNLMA